MRAGLPIFLLLVLMSNPLYAQDNDAGRVLFEGRCAACHQLPDPGQLRPAQWRAVLQTMQTRMKQFNFPPLSEEEFEKIWSYLAANSEKKP
jgi:mono/diheme cytochrome c family protein